MYSARAAVSSPWSSKRDYAEREHAPGPVHVFVVVRREPQAVVMAAAAAVFVVSTPKKAAGA